VAKQDKGSMCACECGERKTSRKKKFAPGHSTMPKSPRWVIRLTRRWDRVGK
jgi:hypothetical protein